MAMDIVTTTSKYANGEKVITAESTKVVKVLYDDIEQSELTLTVPEGETWTVRIAVSGNKQSV